jgi:hypothetical protein
MLLTIDLPSSVGRLCLSPQGTRLAATNEGSPGEVVVVELPSGEQVARYPALDERPAIEFRSEKELLVVHGPECWGCDVTKNTHRALDLGAGGDEPDWLYCCGITGNGKSVVLGGSRELIIAPLAGKARPRRLPLREDGYVRTVVPSHDGRLVAAVIAPERGDREMRLVVVLDMRSGKTIRRLKLPWEQGYGYPLAFRPDNQVLAAGWRNKALQFDLYPPKSPLDPEVVFPGEDWTLHAIGWARPSACHALERGQEVRGVWFSKEGIVLKVLAERGDAFVLAVDEEQVLQHTPAPAEQPDKLWCAAISPGGRAAALAGDDKVPVWDVPGWGEA